MLGRGFATKDTKGEMGSMFGREAFWEKFRALVTIRYNGEHAQSNEETDCQSGGVAGGT